MFSKNETSGVNRVAAWLEHPEALVDRVLRISFNVFGRLI